MASSVDKRENSDGIRSPIEETNKKYLPIYYEITSEKKRIAYIFNITKFEDPTLPERKASPKDVENFTDALKQLGFDEDDIKLHEDKTAKEILKIFKKLDEENPANIGCFVCAIMSHGKEGDIIHGKEGEFQLRELLSYLKPDCCPSLKDIPKLIFVQACRGLRFDNEEPLYQEHTENVPEPPNNILSEIPMIKDMLVFHSSFLGFVSFRNKNDGSWFFQNLSEILKENGRTQDLMNILTAVSNRVASKMYKDESSNTSKQMPCIMSMLTKALIF